MSDLLTSRERDLIVRLIDLSCRHDIKFGIDLKEAVCIHAKSKSEVISKFRELRDVADLRHSPVDFDRIISHLCERWIEPYTSISIRKCPNCSHVLAGNLEHCVHCGAATLFNHDFSFRERFISWYSLIIPKGQFENVLRQLRDDYEERVRTFGCDDRAIRKANIWLIAEFARDLRPAAVQLITWLGGSVGLGAAISWILRRDD